MLVRRRAAHANDADLCQISQRKPVAAPVSFLPGPVTDSFARYVNWPVFGSVRMTSRFSQDSGSNSSCFCHNSWSRQRPLVLTSRLENGIAARAGRGNPEFCHHWSLDQLSSEVDGFVCATSPGTIVRPLLRTLKQNLLENANCLLEILRAILRNGN